MTAEQQAAYIHAQAAAMLVEMEAMKAANQERADQGYALAYDEKAFVDLIDKYGMGHNSIIGFFRG